MPQVAIPAIGAFATTYAGAIITGTLTSATLGLAIVSAVFSGLSAALMATSRKPPSAGLIDTSTSGRTKQYRQSNPPREMVYGEARKSGSLAYVGTTNNRKNLHMIIMLCSHEIYSIDEYVLNGESIPLDYIDGNGNVTSGTYAGKLRLTAHLGTDDQLADSDAVSEISEWTNDFRLQGIAYIHAKFQSDRDVYESGNTELSVWIRGKPIYDVRDFDTATGTPSGTPKAYCNMANIAFDYFTDQRWGMKSSIQRVDNDAIDNSANVCDEIVSVKQLSFNVINADSDSNILTINGDVLGLMRGDVIRFSSNTIGGILTNQDYYVIPYQRMTTPRIKIATSLDGAINDIAVDITTNGVAIINKIGEPRYHGSGMLEIGTDRLGDIEAMMIAMAGDIVQTGETMYFLAGEYRTPTIYLDQDDLLGAISVQPQLGIDDRFNRVQGVYYSPLSAGYEDEYPLVTNSTYESDDGEIIYKTLDQKFTIRSNTAQRIAKIKMDRNRTDLSFTAKFKKTAFNLKTGDNFYFSFPRYGWVNKIFEVRKWDFIVEADSNSGNPEIYIEMKCQETSPDVYDFDKDIDETSVNPAGLNLPNNTITVVNSFSMDSFLVSTKEGDSTFQAKASWELHENASVVQGGKYEIFYKETTDNVYLSAGSVDGFSTEMTMAILKPNVYYDIVIYAYSKLGKRSNGSFIYDFQVGDTITTNVEDWENETIIARDGTDWETDTLGDEDWEA